MEQHAAGACTVCVPDVMMTGITVGTGYMHVVLPMLLHASCTEWALEFNLVELWHICQEWHAKLTLIHYTTEYRTSNILCALSA